jgi:RNA polymerase sigma-70 factor, ECF subfamily
MDRTGAFEALCLAEYPRLVRAAYLIVGDEQEAADLAQESLARAFERWRTVSRYERPGAWCQRVVVNLALSSRRGRARARRVRRADPVAAIQEPPEPFDAEMRAALLELGEQQRAVVVLRFLCGLSVADVAEALDKPEGTVRSLTSQALTRLRDRLGLPDLDDLKESIT